MARGNNNSDEDRSEKALWNIIEFLAGVFWKLLGSFLFGLLQTLKYSLVVFLIGLVAFGIYCFIKGKNPNDISLAMEIIGNALDGLLEAINMCFPDIEKYLMFTSLGFVGAKAIHDKLEERREARNAANNSSDSSNRTNSTNNSPPASSPRYTGTMGVHIKQGLYTDNFDVSYGYKNINGTSFVNSLKISCDIHNEHNRTEKVIFEACVYIPSVHMVYILPPISYNVMPCSIKKADKPCPVDISPTLFDLIQQERIKNQGYIGKEEKWVIRITANRKTYYENTFTWNIVL